MLSGLEGPKGPPRGPSKPASHMYEVKIENKQTNQQKAYKQKQNKTNKK